MLSPQTALATIPGCLGGDIVSSASTPSGNGYWLAGSDGGVFAYGDAQFFGSMGGHPLNKPVVDIVATGTGNGYWLIGADGGVFAYGDAVSPANNPLPGSTLNQPVVAGAREGNTNGLLLTAADGGVFALGGAHFRGSMGGQSLARPVSSITSNPAGTGYWLAARDGGVFAYGASGFFGNAVSSSCTAPNPGQTTGANIVQIATDIQNGHAVSPWGGGSVPYSWGGGHGSTAGPSFGTCAGYTGSIQPCPATSTRGVDCSGFTRWVYKVAYGTDLLGAGNTNNQIARLHKVTTPQPGDLVFYGTSAGNTHHVGVYIGNGKMINALKTGTNIRTDNVTVMSGIVGYYRY